MEKDDHSIPRRARDPNAYTLPAPWVRFIMWGGLGLLLISAILALVILPSRTDAGDMRRLGTIAEIRNLCSALAAYRADTGRYPVTSEGLLALKECPPGVTGWRGPYIDEVPMDKWGHAYQYLCPVEGDPNKFNIISAGADGVFGTGDDVGWWSK